MLKLRHFLAPLVVLLCLFGPSARSQESPPEETPRPQPAMPRGGGGPGMGRPGYGVTWYPARPVEGSGTDFSLVRQSLSGAVPIWKEDGHMVLATASVRHTHFFTDATLANPTRPFPDDLWNVNVGLNYMHQFDNGWSGSVSTGIGSASDKPFHSIDEMNVQFFGSLRIPVRNDRDQWLLSLMYSPTGNLNFPIPGVAYLWVPSDSFQMSIGLPLSVTWKPVDDLTISLMYIPVTNVNARIAYQATERVSLYGAFEWLNEAYFLAERTDRDERFLAFEKRLVGGVCWNLGAHVALDLNAGYAFDRYYGEGENQVTNLRNRVDIASGAFVGALLNVRW